METPTDEYYTVEEAIEFIGTGKVQMYVVAASGLGLMALLLDTMGVSFTIPTSTCELELDTFRKGLLSCMSFLGIVLTAHLWGFLADTLGRNKSIRYSLIGAILFTALAALVPNFWAIIVLRLLSGMSLSGVSSTLYAYMGEMMSNKVRTKLMVMFGWFVGFSVMVMCSVGWIINATQPEIYFSQNYSLTPWRIQWLVLLIPGIIGLFVYLLLPESPHFLVSIGDTQGAHEVLRNIYERNHNFKLDFPIKAISGKTHSEDGDGHEGVKAQKDNLCGMFRSMFKETMILLRPPYLGPILCCCFTQYAIYTVASGLGMWYPEITNRLSFDSNSTSSAMGFCGIFMDKAVESEGNNTTPEVLFGEDKCHVQVQDKMYIDNMIMGAGYLIANTFIYFLQMKMILRHVVILMLTISAVSAFMLPNFNSEVAVLVLFTLMLTTSGSCITTVNIVTIGLFPTFLRGLTLSMTLVLGRIAIVIGVNVMGFLLEINCQATIYIVAAITACAALITMFLMSKKPIS